MSGLRSPRMPTGLPGLDHLLEGGIVRGNSFLIEGPPGSGKSTFAMRMIYEGIVQYDEPGLVITFEEFPRQIYQESLAYGIDLAALEKSGKLRVVWTPPERILSGFSGKSDLVDTLIGQLGVRRLVIDSITHFKRVAHDETQLRETLASVLNYLKLRGINALLVKELERYDDATIAFEEYLVDASMRVYNASAKGGGENVRYVEIRKTRGQGHVSGHHPFAFTDSGIEVYPTLRPRDVRARSEAKVSHQKVPVGVAGIDTMLGGGVWNGSVNLIAGTPGTGKSVLGYHFLDTGLRAGESVMLVSMRNSAPKVLHHVTSLGMNWDTHLQSAKLRIREILPIGTSLEAVLNEIYQQLREVRPGRLVLDSIDDLWGIAWDDDRVRDALLVLTEMVESAGTTTVVLHEMRPQDGVTEVRSDYADVASCVMQVTLVEAGGELRRFFGIRKFSGGDHAKELREFTIDGTGMHVDRKPQGLTGILSGNTSGTLSDIAERVIPTLEELTESVRELEEASVVDPAKVRELRAKLGLMDVLLREHFGVTSFHTLADELLGTSRG
jgi:circadian clock protein KaiC